MVHFFKSLAKCLGSVVIWTTAAFSQDMYFSDRGHTEVFFGWSHAGVSMQYAEFTKASATLEFRRDDIEASTVSAVVQTDSVSSGFGPMDDEFKRRFLKVAAYPEITFVSTNVQRTGETTAVIEGD